MELRQMPDEILTEQLMAAGEDLRQLTIIWQAGLHGGRAPQVGPGVYANLAGRALTSGNPLFGLEVAAAGIAHHPHDQSLAIVHGLALARCGATEHSQVALTRIAESLTDLDTLDAASTEELFGVLARTHKDLGFQTDDEVARRGHFAQAIRWYRHAGRRSGGYWPRINVAAMLALSGQLALAGPDAQRAYEDALQLLDKDHGRTDRYWLMATLGEAAMLLGQLERADRCFRKASEISRRDRRLGELASTRLQARRLAPCVNLEPEWVDGCLPPVRLAIWIGTQANAAVDFAALDVALPAEGLADVEVAYGCLQGIADVALAEALQATGAETTIVLPCPIEIFLAGLRAQSAADVADRAGIVLRQAAQVVVATPGCDQPTAGDQVYARELASGLALLRSRQLCGHIRGIVAGDVAPDTLAHYGATFSAWQMSGLSTNVDLSELSPTYLQSPTKTFLFADFRGFSELTQSGVERFFDVIWGGIARLLQVRAAEGRPALHANTWGDGLYVVYEQAADAAHLALDACDWIRTSADLHRQSGLPERLAIRVGLHAGPAHACVDPVTGTRSYASTHASFASRLEPTTPPGLVYASQAFAALLELEFDSGLDCRLVGQLAWAKGVGRQPTYRILRRGAKVA
jgi:tetratricopeptide (TPR) repeat protein